MEHVEWEGEKEEEEEKVEEGKMWKGEGRMKEKVEEQRQEGGKGYHLPARMKLQRVMKAERKETVARSVGLMLI